MDDIARLVDSAEGQLNQRFSQLRAKMDTGDQAVGQPSIVISLTRLHMKLCAKKYGVFGIGDKSAFVGTAQFSVRMSLIESSTAQEVKFVLCDYDFDKFRKQSASLAEFFVDGLISTIDHCE